MLNEAFSDKGPNRGAPGRLVENIEARILRSALTATEHVLNGARAHVFLLIAGSGRLSREGGETALTGPCVVCLPAGASSRLRFEAGARGAALSLPPAALEQALPSGPFGVHLRSLIEGAHVLRDLESGRIRRLETLIHMAAQELTDDQPAAPAVMRLCLSMLVIEIWRAPSLQAARARPSPQNLVAGFLHLVEMHLSEHWTVRRYADALGVTKDRLSAAVSRATGRSPLAHIHGRLLAEAKNLLSGTECQVAEIAYQLGFSDAAYFNRFFRRKEGMSPGRYRKSVAGARGAGDLSFHAWP